ncbi:MAG: isochorismatase family protein [Burkholderiaceae bacterium]
MSKMDAQRDVLVLVDYQARLLPAIHRGAEAVAAAVMLADAARTLGVRVVGTEQNPAGLGPNVEEIRQRCDTTMGKMHFDACADGLPALLAEGRPAGEPVDIVIAGCEAHVCLLQTALGLLDAGHRLRVVETACGSRRPSDHAAAMRRLHAAGATLVTEEMVVFEWLRSCEHPAFRAVLKQVKAHGPGS